MIVGRDGRKISARYVGLDGLTGLSLLQVGGEGVARPTREAREDKLYVGQPVRLLAPLRVTENRGNRQQPPSDERIYLRVAELRGRLTEIKRVGEQGRISGLTVRALNLSPEIAGGIALNEAGETIGIVEVSKGGEARIMPAALVRKAAERVLARRASVPRPWLGVRGDALTQLSIESLTSLGWKPERAASLLGKREGIFLTLVAAGTPAALANLHPGDIILSVNDAPVKSADDFTFMLNEAGGGGSVKFTLLQPDQISPRVVSVTLSETLNPLRAMDMSETAATTRVVLDPLAVHGVETLTLSKQVAARFGASGGSLLVLSVSPGSSAAIAGLRSGDVVEAVDGNAPGAPGFALPSAPSKQTTLTVVRHKQKITLTLIPDSGVHQQ
jgi:S1-C subfamily serine protease